MQMRVTHKDPGSMIAASNANAKGAMLVAIQLFFVALFLIVESSLSKSALKSASG